MKDWDLQKKYFFKINFKPKHQKSRLKEFNLACFTVHTCEESFLVILSKEYTLQANLSAFVYVTMIFVYIALISYVN